MRKRLAILSLVSLMAASLTSCGEGYNYIDGVMVTINGTPYTTNQLFEKSFGLDSSTGVASYYNILSKIAIEADIKKDASMDSEVANSIAEFKKTAANTAKNNGTTESEEIENALTSAGVDTLEELQDSYYYKQKLEKANSDYTSDDKYTSTYIPTYISEDHPYHVKHILVKYDSDDVTNLYKGTISESDAKDISNVITRLASGETFASVAASKSEDGNGSSEGVTGPTIGGDAGIMSTKTSFVSEFKYGIYTYDAYFNPEISAENKTAMKKGISDGGVFSGESSVNTTYASVAGQNVYGIPYSVAKEILAYSDKTTDTSGKTVTNADATYYPRNVLFNNYFNNHGLSFIYLDETSSDQTTPYGDTYYSSSEYTSLDSGTAFKTVSGISDKLISYTEDNTTTHTTTAASVSGSKKILCDEAGRPILVARASTGSGDSGYSGLHFIVLQNDPYTQTSDELAKYYALEKPSTSTVDTTAEATYVNFVSTTDRSYYNNRISAIKTAVDTYDSNSEYTKYHYYMKKATSGDNDNGITVTVDSKINTAVESYIDNKIATSAESELRTYNTSWETYLNELQQRDYYSNRIIPESAITAFTSGTTAYTSYYEARV